MSKTDKELTVEVVNNFVSSWNSADHTNAIEPLDVIDLIKNVYTTISTLSEEQDQ